MRHGAQLAALIELVACDPQTVLDAKAVHEALRWAPREPRRPGREAAAGLAVIVVAALAVVVGRHPTAASIVYPPDDAIYPSGFKRDGAEIVRYMELAVMPWARRVLGPLVGGSDRVTCNTCHGARAAERGWQMPAVTALPEPDFRALGWEVRSGNMDTQMRNAIYGYIAEGDKQARAAYMRKVVMPGMAALLHRPAYDFTRSYEYNRSRLAFGCYHCHRVR
jgi:hypothetical protein